MSTIVFIILLIIGFIMCIFFGEKSKGDFLPLTLPTPIQLWGALLIIISATILISNLFK